MGKAKELFRVKLERYGRAVRLTVLLPAATAPNGYMLKSANGLILKAASVTVLGADQICLVASRVSEPYEREDTRVFLSVPDAEAYFAQAVQALQEFKADIAIWCATKKPDETVTI